MIKLAEGVLHCGRIGAGFVFEMRCGVMYSIGVRIEDVLDAARDSEAGAGEDVWDR